MLLRMQDSQKIAEVFRWIAVTLGAVLLIYLTRNPLQTFHVPWQVSPTPPAVAIQHGAVVPVSQLVGTGRIYLVQIGSHDSSYSLNDFAGWLHSKYGLDVQVLQPITPDRSAWTFWRAQYAAELLYEQLKRIHPDLAADPNAYLLGFTDADMYSVYLNWPFSYSQRLKRGAIISSARLRDTFWERIDETANDATAKLQARIRRFLLKDIAVLYWHLPLSNDRSSLLHQTLYPDIPIEDIYVSDLHPERTRWGRSEGEACILFAYSSKDGMGPLPGNLIGACNPEDDAVLQDEATEIFEFDLRLGLLIDKHTDFYLPGTVPIEFRRATRDGWPVPMAFGLSGTHSYDKYLRSPEAGSMRRVDIIQEDGGRYNLQRVPSWLPILELVKYVDAGPSNSGDLLAMRWHGSPFEHFEVKKFNGEVETYLPCDSIIFCYLDGYHNDRGEELKFDRDERRRLLGLTSPNGWLRLSYDQANRIAEIHDSRTLSIHYSYDQPGRLSTVTYPSGEVFYYEYDGTQHLLTFSVAPNDKAAPNLVLRNEYDHHGRLIKQTFGDKTYSYAYYPEEGPVATVLVSCPENKTFQVDVDEEDSTVHELPLQSEGEAGETSP